MGFDEVELALEPHYMSMPRPPRGLHYERWLYSRDSVAEVDAVARTGKRPATGAAQTWHGALPAAWHNTTWCADRTIDFLRRNANRPFLLWTSFFDPHHPFDAPEPWSRLHDSTKVDLPKNRKLDFDRRPWWHEAALTGIPKNMNEELRALRENFSRIPQQTDDQLADLIANYYGMISLLDHNVGRILNALIDLGLDDNTYVIYTADHGEWLGDHGLVLKGPMPYEGLLRVPLLVAGPDVPRRKVVEAPVSTMDLSATFGEWTGVDMGSDQHGVSIAKLLRGDEDERRFAYCEWDVSPSRCGVELKIRTVRTRTHKLTIEMLSGAVEMYDLVSDPHELINIADHRNAQPIRRALMEYITKRPNDQMANLPQAVGIA